MAAKLPPSYPIFPPPLPEFYMSRCDRSSSTSTERRGDASQALVRGTKAENPKSSKKAGDNTKDHVPSLPSVPAMASAPLLMIPPLQRTSNAANTVPPLAIYHICRICLRPRSPRYHREHPIPINGLPPPPGICRRCRVTSVEDKTSVEVVKLEESGEVKLGTTCLVPDEDIVSNQEMRDWKAEELLRRSSRQQSAIRYRERSKPRDDIVYRHVRVVEHSPPPRKTKVKFTAQDAIERFNSTPLPAPVSAPTTIGASMQVQPTENPVTGPLGSVKSSAMARMDSAKASVSTRGSSSSGSTAVTHNVAIAPERERVREQKREDSEIRQIAREEIRKHEEAASAAVPDDSYIRKLAREEIKRYRESERKVDAHPGPFTYGRMVPIERRLEIEQDTTEPMPWKQTRGGSPTMASTNVWTESAHRKQSEAKSSSRSSDHEAKSARDSTRYSWGPRWYRDRSIERRSSVVSTNTRTHKGQTTGQAVGRDAVHDRESGPSISVRPREVYYVTKEQDRKKRSSTAKPHILKMDQNEPQDKYDLTKAFENVEVSREPEPEKTGWQEQDRQAPSDQYPRMPKYIEVEDVEIDLEHHYAPDGVQTRVIGIPKRHVEATWFKSGRPIDHESWAEEAVIPNTDSRSSKQWKTSGSGGTQSESTKRSSAREQDASVRSGRTSETQWPGRSDKSRHHPRFGPSAILPYPTEDKMPVGRIVGPADTPTEERSVVSNPSAPVEDVEFHFKERNAESASLRSGGGKSNKRPIRVEEDVEIRETWETSPSGFRPAYSNVSSGRTSPPIHSHSQGPQQNKSPDVEYTYMERIVQPADQPLGSRPFDDAPPMRREEIEEYLDTRRRHSCDVAPPEQKGQSTRNRRRKAHDSEESNHVHFSSKVHISPTPPGSDASSSAFRSFHSSGRGSSRRVDGDDSFERDKDQDVENEQRGRTRGRDARTEYGFVYDKEPTRNSDRDRTVRPRRKDVQHQTGHAGLNGTRQIGGLNRALSESPSREGSRSGSEREVTDGAGPYRTEELTESMEVEEGSRTQRTRNWAEEDRFVSGGSVRGSEVR